MMLGVYIFYPFNPFWMEASCAKQVCDIAQQFVLACGGLCSFFWMSGIVPSDESSGLKPGQTGSYGGLGQVIDDWRCSLQLWFPPNSGTDSADHQTYYEIGSKVVQCRTSGLVLLPRLPKLKVLTIGREGEGWPPD